KPGCSRFFLDIESWKCRWCGLIEVHRWVVQNLVCSNMAPAISKSSSTHCAVLGRGNLLHRIRSRPLFLSKSERKETVPSRTELKPPTLVGDRFIAAGEFDRPQLSVFTRNRRRFHLAYLDRSNVGIWTDGRLCS